MFINPFKSHLLFGVTNLIGLGISHNFKNNQVGTMNSEQDPPIHTIRYKNIPSYQSLFFRLAKNAVKSNAHSK